MAISTPFSWSREAVYFWETCLLFLALLSPGFFDNLSGGRFAEKQRNRCFREAVGAGVSAVTAGISPPPRCHLLPFAGQVVHAHPDILIVGVNLDVEEFALGVEGRVGLLKPHQLSFPALTVSPLIPDVLKHTGPFREAEEEDACPRSTSSERLSLPWRCR